MEHVPLLVLGAGIDGLAASLCLAHQGFPVQLLERGPDPETLDDTAGSTGSMLLRPSAARVLQGLGKAGQTEMPGVFAAGDVRLGSVKRVASAVGEGAMAVQFIHQYLSGLPQR